MFYEYAPLHESSYVIVLQCVLQARQRCGGGRAGDDEAAGHPGRGERLPVVGPARAMEPHQARRQRGRLQEGLPASDVQHGPPQSNR